MGAVMDEIVLSSWGDRFWAWMIDVLIMSILWHRIKIYLEIDAVSLSGALLMASMLFIYWTTLEGYRGQSIGKLFFNIAVTGPLGEEIRYRDAAVEAFGKSFLLPLDFLACLIFFRESRQRLFNKMSNTIVIKQID